MGRQRTLGTEAEARGVALHHGTEVRMVLRPAPAGTGVVFHRTDLGRDVPARLEYVASLALATTLRARGAAVSTVEHLLAALSGCGVSNAIVEVNGPEVPILDGSALPFVELIRKAGVVDQGRGLPELAVRSTVRVGDEEGWVEIRPAPSLSIDYRISFAAPVVGQQRYVAEITPQRFVESIAPARTFGFLDEVADLRKRGLARGGSLDNCVLVDGERVLSGPLRFRDEFVRHKVLDLLGNLALLEMPVRAEVVAYRAGHALHVAAMQALLAEPEAWELVDGGRVAAPTMSPIRSELQLVAALAG
jgi:UDP-3-O-[3-hydroxymyristoyl] N-acetylglucosamine deacetylase